SRKTEGGTFQSSRPLPSSRILWGSITGAGGLAFLFLVAVSDTSPPLSVLRQPFGDHVGKAVVSEVRPVDDPKPAVVQLLPRDYLEGAAIRLSLFVDRDRRG